MSQSHMWHYGKTCRRLTCEHNEAMDTGMTQKVAQGLRSLEKIGPGQNELKNLARASPKGEKNTLAARPMSWAIFPCNRIIL